MPLVEICRNPGEIADETMSHVVSGLPKLIAGVLSCDSRAVSPDEVQILVTDSSQFDRNSKDISMRITAQWSPERAADKEDRCTRISVWTQFTLPDYRSCDVRLILVESAFVPDKRF